MLAGIFTALIANTSKETQLAWRYTPGTQELHWMVMVVKLPTGHENFIHGVHSNRPTAKAILSPAPLITFRNPTIVMQS